MGVRGQKLKPAPNNSRREKRVLSMVSGMMDYNAGRGALEY